jgi:hypothetical protein
VLVATGNVQVRLPRSEAMACLDPLLDAGVDIVVLQEWSPARSLLLRDSGSVRFTPGPIRIPGATSYSWIQTIGDSTVGLRSERLGFEGARPLLLSGFTRGESPTRPLGIEPAQFGLVVRCRERESGIPVSVIGYHLVAGVESAGKLRTDRPRLVARHRREVGRVQAAVAAEQAAGRIVYAAGDANVVGLRLRGLTSVWADQPAGEGTCGGRRIDDIFAPGPATSVTLLENPSDHRAILAAYQR